MLSSHPSPPIKILFTVMDCLTQGRGTRSLKLNSKSKTPVTSEVLSEKAINPGCHKHLLNIDMVYNNNKMHFCILWKHVI